MKTTTKNNNDSGKRTTTTAPKKNKNKKSKKKKTNNSGNNNISFDDVAQGWEVKGLETLTLSIKKMDPNRCSKVVPISC